MSFDDTNLFLKKVKLAVLCLLIAFFNLGGLLPFFEDCPALDSYLAEDKAEEPEAVILSISIAPNQEELTVDPAVGVQETKSAQATASCSPDPCPSGDFFRWSSASGPGVVTGISPSTGLNATLRFTPQAQVFEKDSVALPGVPPFAEGNLSRQSSAEAIATAFAEGSQGAVKGGVKQAGGGYVGLTLLLAEQADSELEFFPTISKVNILFSPSPGSQLNFGSHVVGTTSPQRDVYMVNKAVSANPGAIFGCPGQNTALITRVVIAGTDAIDFTSLSAGAVANPNEIPVPIADNCLRGFIAWDSVTFPLRFSPKTEGPKNATLIIDYTIEEAGLFGNNPITNKTATFRLRGEGAL